MDITNIDNYEMSKIIRYCAENVDNCQNCPADNYICYCIRKIDTDISKNLLQEIDELRGTLVAKENTIIGLLECNTNLDKMVTDLIAENSSLKSKIEELEWRDGE